MTRRSSSYGWTSSGHRADRGAPGQSELFYGGFEDRREESRLTDVTTFLSQRDFLYSDEILTPDSYEVSSEGALPIVGQYRSSNSPGREEAREAKEAAPLVRAKEGILVLLRKLVNASFLGLPDGG
jgi:hypothetical protein